MTDMSRATYVKAPADKPMGLDLKQFEQQATQSSSNANKVDLNMINELMDQHNTIIGVMQRRLGNIKVI